ncbi:MAG: hypothetical protein Q7T74_06590, partial [Candidatus Saccharibacteria bacterium]|nr:hypothetical protein [Candidatus Saccharibacteria bacterium]
IAYSIKAKGLNRDLFGTDEFVLETSKVDSNSLQKSLKYLREKQGSIISSLSTRIPIWRERASISATRLSQELRE